ncbi:MAG: SusC/RagA family TonB-linked outer membrane protein [Bacteroidota bacterium]
MIKSIKILCLVLGLGLLSPGLIQAQDNIKEISSKITNAQGEPIKDALITAGEGAIVTTSDANGNFTIKADPGDMVLIEAKGYSTYTIAASEIIGGADLSLEALKFHMTEDDQVNIPFGELSRRRLTGGVTAIDPKELLTFDNEQSFNGVLNSRVPGLFGNTNIRGLGNALVIVDGIPRPANTLNLQEIDQISVMRSLSSRMFYGAQADQGLILVKTKRGQAFKRTLNVTAETGIQDPISFPSYLGAADYMELFNEALVNDGEEPLYSSDAISNTRSGTNSVLYPNEDFYNSTYLNDMSMFNKVIMESSGGNQASQYYINLGWNRNTSLLNLGEGADERTDRFNIRGNVNYQLNDWLKMSLDGIAIIEIGRGPRYTGGDFWNLASTQLPNAFPVLIPASELEDSGLRSSAVLVGGENVLGGTTQFQVNPFGELTRNGFTNQTDRVLQMNTGLDFDLNGITEGLTAKVFLSFDFINTFIRQQQNSYAVYQPITTIDSTGNTLVSYNKIGVDEKRDDQNINNADIGFERRIGLYGVIDYDKTFDNDNNLKLSAIAYRDQFEMIDVIQPTRNLHFGLRGNYNIKDKYIIEATGVYAGSSFLTGNNRFAFSPSVGLGWVLSEEDFLKESSLFDYVKLTASWAQLNINPISDDFLYRTFFQRDGNFQYNDAVSQNQRLRIVTGNENIDWAQRQEINVGVEALIADRLWIEANYFNSETSDMVAQLTGTYPGILGGEDFTPFENFESFRDQGVELGLNLMSKNTGGFTYSIGANFAMSTPKALIVNESAGLPDSRKLQGKESDARFAYVFDGFFRDEAEIANSPTQTFGEVQPGDIKYQDINGDGVINQDDQQVIGNSNARFQYGLNVRLGYKDFELFVQGFGQTGAERYFNNEYFWVYGQRKYSEEVLNRWTPETAATATYPRLSSRFNANNFRNSTLWLFEDNFFNLRRVQLSYRLPFDIRGIQNITVYARGANLLTISDIRERRELNVGTAPQNRTYALGLFASF